ncbi:MAG: hypothetical protein M1371_04805 [Actinobacteria bacterium]|nr:hypothetical protein [Actinomycetota bacterium]
MKKGQAALLIVAAILIMLGLLFLIENFLPSWMHITSLIWPVIFLAGGFWFLFTAASNHRKCWGLFMPGSILTALGLIFLVTSYLPFTWSFLWPIILISIGIGFFLMMFFGRVFGLIIPAAIFCSLGIAFFIISVLASISSAAWSLLWPLIIVFIGAALMVIFLRHLIVSSFGRKIAMYEKPGTVLEPEDGGKVEIADTSIRGLEKVRLTVSYGGGELKVTPAHGLNRIFDGYLPQSEVESSRDDSRSKFSLRMRGGLPPFLQGAEKSNWELKLTDQVDLNLDFKLGALKADLELGSLMIRSLKFHSGACEGNIKFSSRNPVRMECLSVITGASNVRLSGLANANFDKMELKGGMGEYYLGFNGEALQGANVEISRC